MSNLRNEDRLELLGDLVQMGSQGRAESEDRNSLAKTFYPVPEHLRMLDPDVVLVVGPRGSGKTEMARMLTDARLFKAIAREVGSQRLPPAEKTAWLAGYPLNREGFDARGLRRFLDSPDREPQAMEQLWFAYLVRVLRGQLGGKAEMQGLFNVAGGAPEQVYRAFVRVEETALLALDKLDADLERGGGFIFVAYDDLDIVGGTDWDAMAAGVQGLVAFWAVYARRWRRIRPKVFLRTDLFDRFAVRGGADLAKLAAGRVELMWSDRHLYGMLLRRMANTSGRLSAYVQEARGSHVAWREDPVLGLLPTVTRWTDLRPIIERMIGPYMGANKKKGLSYRWPLAHVRDGRQRAVPRPLVRLFEEAARIEQQSNNPLHGMRILAPISLRAAMDRVSGEHVDHAMAEWEWIRDLGKKLNGLLVPADRREVEGRLDDCGTWDPAPPFDAARDLLDYLVEVGILRQRSDARIDASDLFLHGLELKRKGGIRRR